MAWRASMYTEDHPAQCRHLRENLLSMLLLVRRHIQRAVVEPADPGHKRKNDNGTAYER